MAKFGKSLLSNPKKIFGQIYILLDPSGYDCRSDNGRTHLKDYVHFFAFGHTNPNTLQSTFNFCESGMQNISNKFPKLPNNLKKTFFFPISGVNKILPKYLALSSTTSYRFQIICQNFKKAYYPIPRKFLDKSIFYWTLLATVADPIMVEQHILHQKSEFF